MFSFNNWNNYATIPFTVSSKSGVSINTGFNRNIGSARSDTLAGNVLNIKPTKEQKCKLTLKNWKHTKTCETITTNKTSYEPKSVSVEDIKKSKYFKIDINDYRTLIDQLVNDFKITTDKLLSEAITFSRSESFKTIEGLDSNAAVQKITGKNVLYDRVIELIKNKLGIINMYFILYIMWYFYNTIKIENILLLLFDFIIL